MDFASKFKLSTRLDTPTKNKGMKQLYKTLCAQYHPYLTLSRISVKPPKKLCDLTGLPGPYTCPRTSLRFHNLSVYKYLQEIGAEKSEKFFETKNYASNLFNYKK